LKKKNPPIVFRKNPRGVAAISDPKKRQAIARAGGLARFKKLGSNQLKEISRMGGKKLAENNEHMKYISQLGVEARWGFKRANPKGKKK